MIDSGGTDLNHRWKRGGEDIVDRLLASSLRLPQARNTAQLLLVVSRLSCEKASFGGRYGMRGYPPPSTQRHAWQH